MSDQQQRDGQVLSILDALGLSLASKRKEAMAARAACGIETEWEEDEEHYQGYDDANRHEFVNTTNKPTSSGVEDRKIAGSVVFPNITQPYVDAVSARVGDMLIPTDERNFAIDPTPVPDMLKGVDVPEQAAQPAQAQQPGQPPIPGQQPEPVLTQLDQLKKKMDAIKKDAEEKAENAQTRIDDWLSESQYHAESRKMIDDAAKLGSGVIKGPVPVKRKSSQLVEENGDLAMVMVEEIKPGSKRIDPWNLYPDYPACGESIHNGSFVFEYDQISERKLEDLKGLPGYIDSQIDLCLESGPIGQGEAGQQINGRTSKSLYDIWYFHGMVKAEELIAAGCDCGEEKSSYPAMLTIVNDRVIRASLNPLDNGEFPYDVIPWKRRPGMPWGMGVSRQLRTPQRIVTAATRRLMDNAGLASGPQIVVRRGVSPENGVWEIAPLKVWVEEDDASGQATSPVSAVVIPMLQVELMNIIQLGMKMAEDVTGMPMLMQGQQGKAPDTVGGMTILNNNANSVLRRIARLFDSCITEPHIRRYYAWLMQYGEDPNEKGDFQIIARGSTALVERDIQAQEMVGVLQLCLNPAYKKNPAKAMDEYLKSRRFNPSEFDYTEEEMKAMKEQPPPEDPRITAAKITADARLKEQAQESKDIADRTVAAFRMELQDQQFEAQENERERQNKIALALINEQMLSTQLTSAEKQVLEKLKVSLAETSMKLSTQQNMNRQVITPPTEPVGRAPNGQAFAR